MKKVFIIKKQKKTSVKDESDLKWFLNSDKIKSEINLTCVLACNKKLLT